MWSTDRRRVHHVLPPFREVEPRLDIQPYQTGFWLMPEMKSSIWERTPWGVFVDSVILVSIPLLPAILGGVVASARITLRRTMVAIAIIALILTALVQTGRRARHNDRMFQYHRRQEVGVLFWSSGRDGEFEPQLVDPKGNPVSPQQHKLDQWHESMAQRYRAPPTIPGVPP